MSSESERNGARTWVAGGGDVAGRRDHSILASPSALWLQRVEQVSVDESARRRRGTTHLQTLVAVGEETTMA